MKSTAFIFLFLFNIHNIIGQDTLTNQTIIKLHQAGFGKDILKSKISNTPNKFDVSLDGMLALKKAGVPDDVINQMISKPAENTSTEKNIQSVQTQRLEQGIYYLPSSGAEKLELEPTVMTTGKSSGLGGLSGIFNSRSDASLSGGEAATQIGDKTPKFLFVFDTSAVNDMNSGKASFSNVKSPNEFLLVKLKQGKNSRWISIGKSNNLKETSGIDEKQIILFRIKKLSKGVYEVEPKEDLSDGEYCFMFAEGSSDGGTNKVFDFSLVKGKKGF